MQNLLANHAKFVHCKCVPETQTLPDFTLNKAIANLQIRQLSTAIYAEAETYDIRTVRLLTPSFDRPRMNGQTVHHKAMEARVFESDAVTGSLKDTHHHLGNILFISLYQGTLEFTAGPDSSIYKLEFKAHGSDADLRDGIKAQGFDLIEDHALPIDPEVQKFTAAMERCMPKRIQPIRPQPKQSISTELSDMLGILGPIWESSDKNTPGCAPA